MTGSKGSRSSRHRRAAMNEEVFVLAGGRLVWADAVTVRSEASGRFSFLSPTRGPAPDDSRRGLMVGDHLTLLRPDNTVFADGVVDSFSADPAGKGRIRFVISVRPPGQGSGR